MAVTPIGGLFANLSEVYAVFLPDADTILYMPVEAWDSLGQAWVIGDTALVQASALPGFTSLLSKSQLRTAQHGKPPQDVHIVHVPPGQPS